MFIKILSFILGFIIGYNFTKLVRIIFLKFMSLKFKEKKYKNLFNNFNGSFWEENEIKSSDFEKE